MSPTLVVAAIVAMAALSGCDGRTAGPSDVDNQQGSPSLVSVHYGRLVDVYSYRRIEMSLEDRRDTLNRSAHPIRRNVLIGPDVEGQDLFNPTGGVRDDADYRFLPFDVGVGHEELVILWDDRADSGEDQRFASALARATASLGEVSAAYRDQNTALQPIPVVPRNAALMLTFDRPLGISSELFLSNPSAIQLLRFRDDPNTTSPTSAFEVATTRMFSDGGKTVLIDTTLIGDEALGSRFSDGLVPSPDNQTANYRIAIPTDGVASDQLRIKPDDVAQLNGVDKRGDQSVIRDFRAGNESDGRSGSLSDVESPTIIALKGMGIIGIDASERVLTINKRANLLALRGRVPFVDGGIADSGLPGGPPATPTANPNGNPMPLPSGDFVYQDVISPFTQEVVRIRAEILANLDVGTSIDDPEFAGLGRTADGTDGGELVTARVLVSTVKALDSEGNEVTFESSDLPLGADCDVAVRYYEFVNYRDEFGVGEVSDAGRRAEFVTIDPPPPIFDEFGDPLQDGTRFVEVDPDATFSVRFSEPIDLSKVSPIDNFVLTTEEVNLGIFQDVLAEPKSASLLFLASRLRDQNGDGTLLELIPPYGLFHEQGQTETYWAHVDLGASGLRDLGNNPVDIFDRRPAGTIQVGTFEVEVPLQNFSIDYDLDADAEENLVASRLFRFASIDEDGTKSGSVDFFGQFRIDRGRLFAAQTSRRSFTADDQNLGAIQRWDKGECVQPGSPGPPPTNPMAVPPPAGTQGPGVLYWTPSMIATRLTPPLACQPPAGPQLFGGITEPHTKRGSRVQMTYREDDFGLEYHDANDLNLDVEQLHWAPWNDGNVLFDRFDRYTMTLSHSRKRPDLLFIYATYMPPPPAMPQSFCALDCMSLFSGLSTTFADNPLPRGTSATVVRDREYVVNPNNAFRASSGKKYVPYPRFERSYTWRNHLQVNWDVENGVAYGLGGAIAADSDPSAGGDRTASVSSPWITDDYTTALTGDNTWDPSQDPGADGRLVRDQADFLGDRSDDHDPIALPLLVDVMVWPDDTQQIANAANLFHIAYVGPNPLGYYNTGPGITTLVPFPCTNIDWPFFRVHTTGGTDANTQETILVEPDLQTIATGGTIKDCGLGDPTYGLFPTKPGDDHLQWAQIDLVRKVSFVTFGFFDTVLPNQHDLVSADPPLPGLGAAVGRPDFSGYSEIGVRDMISIMDPPVSTQPGGTKMELQFRGIQVLPNSDGLYDPQTDDTFDGRKNLLNPNYACEAFRYAMPNPGGVGDGPRVVVEGMTPYVLEDDINTIRNSVTGLMPRFINMRLVMENNIFSTPAAEPSLRSLMVVYRMGRPD